MPSTYFASSKSNVFKRRFAALSICVAQCLCRLLNLLRVTNPVPVANLLRVPIRPHE